MYKYFILCFFLLSACQQVQPVFLSARPAAERVYAMTSQPGGKVRLALGKAPRTAAPFRTQQACTISEHLDHIRVYLIQGATSLGSSLPLEIITPLNLVNLGGPNPFVDIPASVVSSGDTQLITLGNIPAGSYYLAAAARNASNENITNTLLSAPGGSRGNIISVTGTVAVSNGGGDPANLGRVTVGGAPDYLIQAGSDRLTINLRLSGLACL